MAKGSTWRWAVSAMRHPVVAVLVLKLLELCAAWLERRRRALTDSTLRLSWRDETDETDSELVQGCLMSTEHLLSQGRVEKRTLWRRPLLQVLGGNLHLRAELLRAVQVCQAKSGNSLVTRWIPRNERYHVLQASLDEMSSLFGTAFVHFNDLASDAAATSKGGDSQEATWYCLTVSAASSTTADKYGLVDKSTVDKGHGRKPSTSARLPEDNARPHSTLRVVLVNESELRRIGDGKLYPPSSGFLNARHAGRYRVLQDFARNFQTQLVKPSVQGAAGTLPSPTAGESAGTLAGKLRERSALPDGGLMKRIHSVPHNMSQSNMVDLLKANTGASSSADLRRMNQRLPNKKRHSNGLSTKRNALSIDAADEDADLGDGGDDAACFLRLHVPHFANGRSRSSVPLAPWATTRYAVDPEVEPELTAGAWYFTQ